ncbi:MAG: hypothetical protein KF724_08375 [Phycisphaeraceae bacterium]|nr:hypothetical protein [Phycisphaeraceae bacterium]
MRVRAGVHAVRCRTLDRVRCGTVAIVLGLLAVLPLRPAAGQGLESYGVLEPIRVRWVEASVLEVLVETRHDGSPDAIDGDDHRLVQSLLPLHDAYLARALQARDEAAPRLILETGFGLDLGRIRQLRRREIAVDGLEARLRLYEQAFLREVEAMLPEAARERFARRAVSVSRLTTFRPYRRGLVDATGEFEAKIRAAKLPPSERRAAMAVIDANAPQLHEHAQRIFRSAREAARRYLVVVEQALAGFPIVADPDALSPEQQQARRTAVSRAVVSADPYRQFRRAALSGREFEERLWNQVLEAVVTEEARRALRREIIGPLWGSSSGPRLERGLLRAEAQLRAMQDLDPARQAELLRALEQWRREDDATVLAILQLIPICRQAEARREDARLNRATPEARVETLEAEFARRSVEISTLVQSREDRAQRTVATLMEQLDEPQWRAMGFRLPGRPGDEADRRPMSERAHEISWLSPSEVPAVDARLSAEDEHSVLVGQEHGGGWNPRPIEESFLELLAQAIELDEVERRALTTLLDEARQQWSRRIERSDLGSRRMTHSTLDRSALPNPLLSDLPSIDEHEGMGDDRLRDEAVSLEAWRQWPAIQAAQTQFEANLEFLAEVVAIDRRLFAALESRVGAPARRPWIAVAELARLSIVTGPRSGMASFVVVGEPAEVNLALLAMGPLLGVEARHALAAAVAKRSDALRERLLTRAEAALDMEHSQHVRDEWFILSGPGNLWLEQTPEWQVAHAEFDSATREWTRHTRAIDRLSREIVEEVRGALEGEARREFEEIWIRLAYPDVVRNHSPTPWIIAQLRALEGVEPEEREAIDRISAEWQRARQSVTDEMIRVTMRALEEIEGDHARRDQGLPIRWHHHAPEVERWRFLQDEADDRAQIELRAVLSKATLEQVPLLGNGLPRD